MLVMILENVPASVRGELTRWMLEPKAGVFVGQVSALVRDKLWEKAIKAKRAGAVMQIWSTNTEQRFAMRSMGDSKRQIVEMEGLYLIRYLPEKLRPKAEPAEAVDEKMETKF